jgi:ferredoxin
MKRIPQIAISECTDCESCLELCPSVFKKNKETGLIEVIDLSEYPEDDIEEAMSMCPADCISWEKVG